MPDDFAPRWPLEGISQRLPPSNILAEQSLLGALFHNNKALERCRFLKPEHFADPIHARIYQTAVRRIDKGQIADGVTLKGDFENAGILDEVGGTAYLSQLMATMVGIINVSTYAQTIRDCWIKRQAIEIGEQLVNAAFGADPEIDPAQLASQVAHQLDQLSASHSTEHVVTLDAAMDSALAAMDRAAAGATSGISSGFQSIDQRLGGLEPGQVYVLAGRPGMGKSALGHQIAIRVARAGVGVLELSLEMSAQQLGRRTLATAARVPIMAMKAGRVNAADAGSVVRARKELAGLPLSIDDAGGQTAEQIAGKARSLQRKHGLGLIMVDHLNLMRAEDHDAKHGGTWAVERASATMLQLAKDCACPVLLLAQLNRGVEGREDKRPGLADLRQAGAIEQDAYAVGFVYRPEYYLGGEPETKAGDSPARTAALRQEWLDQKAMLAGRADLIWAKVRDGEPGTDRMTFHGPTATFGEPDDGR